jgi:hypothetical protein
MMILYSEALVLGRFKWRNVRYSLGITSLAPRLSQILTQVEPTIGRREKTLSLLTYCIFLPLFGTEERDERVEWRIDNP